LSAVARFAGFVSFVNGLTWGLRPRLYSVARFAGCKTRLECATIFNDHGAQDEGLLVCVFEGTACGVDGPVDDDGRRRGGTGSMDEVILAQTALLRGQMNLKQKKKKKKKN
jgi:hypothetical protein